MLLYFRIRTFEIFMIVFNYYLTLISSCELQFKYYYNNELIKKFELILK